MKILRLLTALLLFALFFFSTPPRGLADEYDDSQSHPLRVVAYLVHPVAVLLEWVTTRPFHALVSGNKELEHISGHQPHPPIFADPQITYNFGASKRTPMSVAEAPKRVAPNEPIAETVTVKEVIVEKAVLKEVPKIVEVEKVVFSDVAFRFNSADLTDLGKGKVYLTAQKLKEKSDIAVVIEGHADYVGSEEYNQRLGLRRADKVMKELAQFGIEPARMSAASFGESKPVVEEKTDWGRAVNRRVEFKITTP